ncbi:MAG: Gfo/Idh/MocA family oxidoreductase [candidate division WOR-3 bacterium]|nr:Gfo/Idh/MocA family oxidoreductase [candidate division WOR-3 bacterium]
MKKKLRVGIIGCGTQAQLAYIPALRRNHSCEIVALCDSDVRKLNLLSTRYNIKKRYGDFDDLRNDSDIDAVIISTPNYLHAPMAIGAMEYGKDVLCEMPMAVNSQDASAMVETAKQKKRKLIPCLNDRLRPDVITIKKFINGGELGSLFYTKAGWLRGKTEWSLSSWWGERLRAGGGAFLSLGCQILDFALSLLEPARPTSIVGTLYKREASAEVEDSAFAMLRFPKDLVLTIEVGWSLLQKKDFTYFNIFGSKGAALLNPIQIHREMHGHLVNVTPSLPERDFQRASYQLLIDLFVDSILKEIDCPIKCEDGLLINRIIDAFYQSAKTKKEVKIH